MTHRALHRLAFALLAGCATPHATTFPAEVATGPTAGAMTPEEKKHFKSLRQLTFGGENAEAYFSFDGTRLSFQARGADEGCDRIYTMPTTGAPTPTRVSSGLGATTCAHYFPDGNSLLFASTHLGAEACPPRPDMSQGYVWAIHDTFDIFSARADGSELKRLTETPGYDAEGTVCAKDGSIIFTSVRDGDLELYRMDKDGKNVKRLTHTPGYDGGAFFNHDCSKIVWRASRPLPGRELEEYRALLGQGLVRPTKLELYVANADGSDARQITYLNAASFAPFWHPTKNRILFSTNYPDAQGREFDLWAVNSDGTNLERITWHAGFDGFPMFSPDGKQLVFSSNRATPKGARDTNVFLAEWVDGDGVLPSATAADRIRDDVKVLADERREGRGVGTHGLEEAGAMIEARFKALGARPLFGDSYREPFEVPTAVRVHDDTALVLGKTTLIPRDFLPASYSANTKVEGPLVLAGYGVVDEKLKIDDFKGLNVKGKIVVVRRFVGPAREKQPPEVQRRLGDVRQKTFQARQRGAKALLVVDAPVKPAVSRDGTPVEEAPFPPLVPQGRDDSGIPVMFVKRAAFADTLAALEARQTVQAIVAPHLSTTTATAFNVGAVFGPSGYSPSVVIGAHYDHLGFGGRNSLAPDSHQPHLGADDNASGTATLLEIARAVSKQSDLPVSIAVVAFSGEEEGDLGSSHFVKSNQDLVRDARAMVNLDMVGRMTLNSLQVLGAESADGWKPLVDAACRDARVLCTAGGDGYGPSDHMEFYAAGVPVLHFFTGPHGDYHKPSDTPDKLNYAGAAAVAEIVLATTQRVSGTALTLKKLPAPPPAGDARTFGASLGTIPDYAGPQNGKLGVLVSDVRPGGAAALGGIVRGDLLVKLGPYVVQSVHDLMYALQALKPGQRVTAVVEKADGTRAEYQVTMQEPRR